LLVEKGGDGSIRERKKRNLGVKKGGKENGGKEKGKAQYTPIKRELVSKRG